MCAHNDANTHTHTRQPCPVCVGYVQNLHACVYRTGCFTLYCGVNPNASENFYRNGSLQPNLEHCKLSGLPDLNHSDPSVLSRMVDWQRWMLDTFQPDGLRYDAVTNSKLVRKLDKEGVFITSF